ncbi:hypothetical protein [Streptomyces sp. NPDC058718]|uniref:hypothetical protein n=1 Tax=Streptomyces sp. NPDC058718 TaxID=3346610 RepID=UPI0036A53CD0
MTAARRLADTRALDPHLAYEEWPDGTFGGTRPITGWTPEQQAAHRADLEAALRQTAA